MLIPCDAATVAVESIKVGREMFSTTSYLTSTRGEFNLDSTSSDIYVTIDGVPTTSFTTTTTANTITVVFATAPEANTFIQIAGFNKSTT